jgi:hypothetical protein
MSIWILDFNSLSLFGVSEKKVQMAIEGLAIHYFFGFLYMKSSF